MGEGKEREKGEGERKGEEGRERERERRGREERGREEKEEGRETCWFVSSLISTPLSTRV